MEIRGQQARDARTLGSEDKEQGHWEEDGTGVWGARGFIVV